LLRAEFKGLRKNYAISPPVAKYIIEHITIPINDKRTMPDITRPNMDMPTFSDFNPLLPNLTPKIAITTITMMVNKKIMKISPRVCPEKAGEYNNSQNTNNKQRIMIARTRDFLA
jgi:hypothetical protein